MENKLKVIPSNVKSYMDRIEQHGYESYIVGGAVRDLIIGETPKDWDIFTNALGIQNIFPEGKVIGGEERQEKILTVVVDGVEISAYRKSGDRKETGGTIKEHLSTCDYSFNAIAMSKDGVIYDPFLGQESIEKHIIKAVGNPIDRMNEDKLRAFRGVRFMAKYQWAMDTDTLNAIRSTDITSLPPERIKDELMKIFNYELGLVLLRDTGLLEQFWPEFIPMVGMDGGHHHNEDVWTHTDAVYRYSCRLTNNVVHHIACALHDIGKPPRFKVENGKINFKGHDYVGSKIAADMMGRLKFPNRDIEYVGTLIYHHLFGISGEPRLDKGYRRLYESLEKISKRENSSYPNIVEDLTLLFYCDYQGNLANPREKFVDYLCNDTHVGSRITRYYYIYKGQSKPFSVSDLKVKGSDIINLGVEPGERIGKLLKEVYNLTVEGILKNDRHEQMLWLRGQVGK